MRKLVCRRPDHKSARVDPPYVSSASTTTDCHHLKRTSASRQWHDNCCHCMTVKNAENTDWRRFSQPTLALIRSKGIVHVQMLSTFLFGIALVLPPAAAGGTLVQTLDLSFMRATYFLSQNNDDHFPDVDGVQTFTQLANGAAYLVPP